MIRALIFDMGGVLARTGDPAVRQQLAAEMSLSPEELFDLVFRSPSWRQAEVGHISSEAHWETVARHVGWPGPDAGDDLRARFFAGTRLDRDLVALICRARAEGLKTALLSNASDDLRQGVEVEWNIPPDTFDELFISAEMGLAKPDPAIFRLALERLGVAPHEALFVDDRLDNIEAAQALGLDAIRFISPEALLAELRARLDWLNDD
ncbi:MAG: HAD family phosphatase [Chloroflexi bacterium]|nr:HAD family phosphatase [Chloroflexota bacterium]MBU1747478.1 HAD family phosphatase [Chloroflexota bacterium]MBU1879748.1 HAD family phosphatase [Chloroflexota bacterium]